MADQLKDLAGKLRKIGGVQSLDLRKRRNLVSTSASTNRDAESSGLVQQDQQAMSEKVPVTDASVDVEAAIDPAVEEDQDPLVRKRK